MPPRVPKGKQKAEPDADVEDEAPAAKKPKGKQKAEPDADVEDEAPAAKKPKGKHKAEPVRPTIAPEAVAKMSMGALALTSCLPAVKLL